MSVPAEHQSVSHVLGEVIDAYIAGGAAAAARKGRRLAAARFARMFGDLEGWRSASIQQRRQVRTEVMSFAAHAVIATQTPVDAAFVAQSRCHWGIYVHDAYPEQHQRFTAQATELGFSLRQCQRMWSHLARICVVSGLAPEQLTAATYQPARAAFFDAALALHDSPPHKSLSTPLFGLDVVMFHRGQAERAELRRIWNHRPAAEVDWDQISTQVPVMAHTMRRYLQQCSASLRPSSVTLFNTTLRQFAAFLTARHPGVTSVADLQRRHIEDYRAWLDQRPGYRGQPGLTKTTLGMRMGHLHTFFTRITEWDYPDQPRTGLVFREDRPRLDRPLPKFLDDARAAAFMTAAARLPDELDRLMVQILARTGMRRGELLGLRIDAVVQIGTGYWLRTPVGKLHTDRYIPLDPALKTLIDDWIAQRPSWQASDLLLLERGRPIPPTRVDTAVQKAATAAGIGHVHPHQLRHTLATQAINRGMSLEAIAALLGHADLSMTLVYARIGDRTVADQYFQVTSKIEALYQSAKPTPAVTVLPADTASPAMTALHAEVDKRLLGNGYCRRPVELDCRYETICETCPMFFTTHQHRPVLQAQRDDACAKGQTRRAEVYASLLEHLDQATA